MQIWLIGTSTLCRRAGNSPDHLTQVVGVGFFSSFFPFFCVKITEPVNQPEVKWRADLKRIQESLSITVPNLQIHLHMYNLRMGKRHRIVVGVQQLERSMVSFFVAAIACLPLLLLLILLLLVFALCEFVGRATEKAIMKQGCQLVSQKEGSQLLSKRNCLNSSFYFRNQFQSSF